jgi:hypothetical protein
MILTMIFGKEFSSREDKEDKVYILPPLKFKHNPKSKKSNPL